MCQYFCLISKERELSDSPNYTTAMEAQNSFPANLPGIYYHSQSCLDHSPPFTGWIDMNEPSWTSTPTQSFELPVDFHTLPNTDFTKETPKTYPESISVNVDLPSPRIEKVAHKNSFIPSIDSLPSFLVGF